MSDVDSALSRLACHAAAQQVQALPPAQACTLRATVPSVVCIVSGRAWVTRLGPHAGTAEGGPQGDEWLSAGQEMRLATHDAVVLEAVALPGHSHEGVRFTWRADAPRHTRGAGALIGWLQVQVSYTINSCHRLLH